MSRFFILAIVCVLCDPAWAFQKPKLDPQGQYAINAEASPFVVPNQEEKKEELPVIPLRKQEPNLPNLQISGHVHVGGVPKVFFRNLDTGKSYYLAKFEQKDDILLEDIGKEFVTFNVKGVQMRVKNVAFASKTGNNR